MCAVSFVGEHYTKKWHDLPWVQPITTVITSPPEVTRSEFDQLRRDVLEMKELLLRAKEYDERTGQPDCETADKVELLRRVAELVDVDLEDVFATD